MLNNLHREDNIYIISNTPYQFAEDKYDSQYGYQEVNQYIKNGFSKLLSENNIDTSSSYLEIGSGTGVLTLPVLQANLFPHHLITDSSIIFLNLLRIKMQSLSFEASYDLCSMKGEDVVIFPDKCFSLIALRYVLHHIDDWIYFIKICKRKLVPGGAIIFEEPTINGAFLMSFAIQFLPLLASSTNQQLTEEEVQHISHLKKITALYHNRIILKSDYEDKHMFQVDQIMQLAHDSGFIFKFYPSVGIDCIEPFHRDNFLDIFLYNCRHNLSFPEPLVKKIENLLGPYMQLIETFDEQSPVSYCRGIFVLKVPNKKHKKYERKRV
jgi:ubiquinone/menaquinone biosynthesis C-methylase UbiE